MSLTRRQFLRGASYGLAAAGTGALLAGPLGRRSDAAGPRVVVVGGGLAGATAAYRINRLKGWVPQLYEAQSHIGGRTRTITDLSGGQYAESGGGGINTRDASIKALAQEIGLWPLVDTWKNWPDGDELLFVGGSTYTWSQIKTQVNQNINACWRAWVAMGKGIPTYASHSAKAVEYDNMTVSEFLDTQCPHGLDTPAGKMMEIEFGVEYGGRAEDSSAIHQILEGASIWGGGGWDERWAIPGGNQQLSLALADALGPANVHLGQALVALKKNTDGTITLTFDNGGILTKVVADRVVLAVPPTTLRDVDLTKAGFGKVKMRSINDQDLGSNSKLNFQFSNSPWGDAGKGGEAISDSGLAESWQANFISATPAVLIAMNNQNYGAEAAHGPASPAVVSQTLGWIDQLYPGASSTFIAGQAYLDYWPNDPWAKGSYSFYKPGGFTSYAGVQQEKRGNIAFAGEHTAIYIERGYMNGAVATGERAAREIAKM